MAIKVLFILLSLLVLSSTQACLALSPNCWNCSYIYEPQLNYYSCSRCATGYYSIAMSTNVHNTYYVCKPCSDWNILCAACQSNLTVTSGVYCTVCAYPSYGIPYGVGVCTPCPTNCVTCSATTTGVGNACGGSVNYSQCGTNGLGCSQCALNYTLGSIDLNCYYCPTVIINCLVNSCTQVALGVFSCNTCQPNYFTAAKNANGTSYYICQLCSTVSAACLTCTAAPAQSAGIQCNSCLSGYGVPYLVGGCNACASHCLACSAAYNNNGNVCGANVTNTNCGTNGLVCSQCAANYTLGTFDKNCYYCPTVVANCLVNSCSQVAVGVFNCSSCATGYFSSPMTANGITYYICRPCNGSNSGCTACSYNSSLSSGVYCTSCSAGYAIPYPFVQCLACPSNCIACLNSYGSGTINACGNHVSYANCGTNGLACYQCATNYSLGRLDQNCYYCPTVSANCLVNSCVQVAYGVFSCSICSNNKAFLLNTTSNGNNITICQLCTAVDPNCLTCTNDSYVSSGMHCLSCATGYAVTQVSGPTYGTCQPCGSNCLACQTNTGNGCGTNISYANCGTNGLLCSQCATGFYININANCYNCSTLSANCNQNSCTYVSPGVYTCNSCSNGSFSAPLTINGVNYTVNGSLVWMCQLCFAGGSNCLTCAYDPLLASQMVCESCVAGYAVSFANGSNYGTCQSCQNYCQLCQYNQGASSLCGVNIPSSSCGTNGMACNLCATNYTLGIDANCYYCPLISPNCLVNSCSEVAYGYFSCSACESGYFTTPMNFNGTIYYVCQPCNTSNVGCTTCQYAPSFTYGIQCTVCVNTSYGIPYGIWGCTPCPTNCVTCSATTTGVGNACGGSVSYSQCGTNGLGCSQCALNYTLGSIDLNCYYCPTVITNCLVNSCIQVALGVFSCNSCAYDYYSTPINYVGILTNITYYVCESCSIANQGCTTCNYDSALPYGIICSSCIQGYGLQYEIFGCYPCATGCLACEAYTTGMGSACGANLPSINCGTNGLICTQCATNYTLGTVDLNCYYCPNVSPNCVVGSCSEIALRVFSCSLCINSTFFIKSTTVNGSTINICSLCSSVDPNCVQCLPNAVQSNDMICTLCIVGFAPNYWATPVSTCQECGSNCVTCLPYQQTNGCGGNISASACGTNGLICKQCAEGYILSAYDGNCYLCSVVSPNCNPSSCQQTSTGQATCSQCVSGSFLVPTSSGSTAFSCQLCSSVDPNCQTCIYNDCQSTNMVCTACASSYALNYWATVLGTCQSCGVDCLACVYVPSGIVNCTQCSSNSSISIPLVVNRANYTVNGNLVWLCQPCSINNSNCLTCTYDDQLPTGIFCSSCLNGYTVVTGACLPCSANCLFCQQITENGCGASVPIADCGTNGLICSQCAVGYFLLPNGNCYSCQVLSPGCNAGECQQISLGIFTCNQCSNDATLTPVINNGVQQVINGTNVYSCLMCPSADSNCLTCIYDPAQQSGIICTSCNVGYTPNYYWMYPISICQACGSGCLTCSPYQETNGCSGSASLSNCGTNGLLCTQCAAGYIINTLSNCLSCTSVSPNCNPDSCSEIAVGVYNCSLCASNAFSLPTIANGVQQVVNGVSVYGCQLCSSIDSNCQCCTYYASQSTNMICTCCVEGFIPNYYATPIGICQQCGSNCLSCQPYQQSSGCTAQAEAANCGTNGLLCTLCASGYSLDSEANCQLGISVELQSDLGTISHTDWLWLVLVLVGVAIAVICIILYLRNKSGERDVKKQLLSAEIEMGNISH